MAHAPQNGQQLRAARLRSLFLSFQQADVECRKRDEEDTADGEDGEKTGDSNITSNTIGGGGCGGGGSAQRQPEAPALPTQIAKEEQLYSQARSVATMIDAMSWPATHKTRYERCPKTKRSTANFKRTQN